LSPQQFGSISAVVDAKPQCCEVLLFVQMTIQKMLMQIVYNSYIHKTLNHFRDEDLLLVG